MKIRASLYFQSDVMIGAVSPDESQPHLHLHFRWRDIPMRVFLASEDLARLLPAAREYFPKAALAGHAVVRVLTAEGDSDLPNEISVDDLRRCTHDTRKKEFL